MMLGSCIRCGNVKRYGVDHDSVKPSPIIAIDELEEEEDAAGTTLTPNYNYMDHPPTAAPAAARDLQQIASFRSLSDQMKGLLTGGSENNRRRRRKYYSGRSRSPCMMRFITAMPWPSTSCMKPPMNGRRRDEMNEEDDDEKGGIMQMQYEEYGYDEEDEEEEEGCCSSRCSLSTSEAITVLVAAAENAAEPPSMAGGGGGGNAGVCDAGKAPPSSSCMVCGGGGGRRSSSSSSRCTYERRHGAADPAQLRQLPPEGAAPDGEHGCGEWVAQVETGVFLCLFCRTDGRNELRRIRFSREMFDKYEAQQWWANNCEKVHELYNISTNYRRLFATLPSSSNFKDENYVNQNDHVKAHNQELSESGDMENLDKSRVFLGPQDRAESFKGSVVSSPTHNNSVDVSKPCHVAKVNAHDSMEINEPDISNTPYEVYEDQPGVYITIATSSKGLKELKRLRFSREMFDEARARLWWEENRVRIHQQYL